MNDTAGRLTRMLEATAVRLAGVSDADASQAGPGRWSKKQILGHPIDSAVNNRQRFVRAQLAPAYDAPAHEQESWVAVQGYATESWTDLVNLCLVNFWLVYNRHLVHVIRNVKEGALPVPCAIGGDAPLPLSEVMSSYVDHMEHHLAQILG